MVPPELIDAPWYADLLLAAVLLGAALAQYVAIAIDGHSWPRWLMAIGWSGLAARMVVALALYGNVPINVASMPFLAAVAGGTVLMAWQMIVRAGRPKVWCLQEPDQLCQREDRLREAIVHMHRRGSP